MSASSTRRSAMPATETMRQALEAIGQEHLLRFADGLPSDRLHSLVEQIESLDLESLPSLVETYVKRAPVFELSGTVEPASYYPADAGGYDRDAFTRAGEELLRNGKVACFTVAGGQGSRLGFDGPKGCYPAGAVTGKSLFQIFAEGILATGKKYGTPVPWLIMTSPLNHDATVSFFAKHDHFGLSPDDVFFFPQGTMPSFDMKTGRILLASPSDIATSPDGHGGSLKALRVSGALDALEDRGVEHISYFQVDNPLVKVADPLFLGLHASAPDSSAEMSSKMLPKAYAEEKVGLFVKIDGRTQVVEYSDMPMEMQKQTNDDGSLVYLAGNPAIHAFSVSFVRKVNTDPDFRLPFHRAVKKIRHIDLETGEAISPSEPNGVKLEQFVFDALPFARDSIILETSREEEFAPIKNAEGIDSAESSARLQSARAARWLEAAGVRVPRASDGRPDCTL
ncbi:MAG TPA: UDPGP type 1 family protein, partial [Phycisphaerales bacterium]|nr:UDPGP type 1 family protein [Phycisphaerales bacterium]